MQASLTDARPTDALERDLQARSLERSLTQAVSRASVFSYILAVACALYGLLSLADLRRFKPELTLLDNTWPRLVFSSLPYLGLGLFMRRSPWPDERKLLFWALLQGVIYSITSTIQVWPLALAGHPQVMLHVNGINMQYVMSAILIVCVPRSLLLRWLPLFCFSTLAPILMVTYLAKDSWVFGIVLNDSLNGLLAGIACSVFIGRVYERHSLLEVSREEEASHFLGEELHSAIFEDRKDLLEESQVNGLILSLDIRGSSKLTRQFGAVWAHFIHDWMAEAPGIIHSNGGKLIKTAGDSLLVTFGVFDPDADLSGIPALERDAAAAEHRRWEQRTESAIVCATQLHERFQTIARRYFPSQRLRIGIDRGRVWKGVRGSEQRKELDVWGDPVNCAARLESYTKTLAPRFEADRSILVVSPYAADYLVDRASFTRVETGGAIPDFPGLRWLLTRVL